MFETLPCLSFLYRKDIREEGGEGTEGAEPDPDCEEHVSAPAFDDRSAGPETFHDTFLGGAYDVGKREDQENECASRHYEGEERTSRAARDKRRPGQTGQDRTRSPEARERISEPKYGECEHWSLAALACLEFGERLRELRDGMETGRRKEVELEEAQDD